MCLGHYYFEFVVIIFYYILPNQIVTHIRNTMLKSLKNNANFIIRGIIIGNSLAVRWLGLHALTAEGLGSISGGGTKIPQAMWCS